MPDFWTVALLEAGEGLSPRLLLLTSFFSCLEGGEARGKTSFFAGEGDVCAPGGFLKKLRMSIVDT
jgi:hypothetical protein